MPAHPHAELMALYAKDATETDKPWERWEWFDPFLDKWTVCINFLSWSDRVKYRRKPERPWYRVALMSMKNDLYTFTADSGFVKDYNGFGGYSEISVKSHPNFVKWLTDRVYYDVE